MNINRIVSNEEILNLIKNNPNITIKELTDKIGYCKPHMYARIKELKNKKLIKTKTIRGTLLQINEVR